MSAIAGGRITFPCSVNTVVNNTLALNYRCGGSVRIMVTIGDYVLTSQLACKKLQAPVEDADYNVLREEGQYKMTNGHQGFIENG